MAINGLESAFGGMLGAIAEKGGSSVELHLESMPQSLRITRGNGSGMPVEEFQVLFDSSLSHPVVSYVFRGELPLNLAVAGVPKLLEGTPLGLKDSDVLYRFLEGVNKVARQAHYGPVACQQCLQPNRLPLVVAYFAERMIPGL